jgi:hypothetical protein
VKSPKNNQSTKALSKTPRTVHLEYEEGNPEAVEEAEEAEDDEKGE